jgi:predicted RNA binding protein YcfA (HicA-like mRNA interferase family)
MRIPRDLNGPQLIKALGILGYKPTRQSGSHIRLTTTAIGTHHITIPNHRPIRIGTLASILDEVAAHHHIGRDELLAKLKL